MKVKIIVKYYIGKNPLYATGDYRQRMEGVFVKAAIKRGQKSLLILLSVSRLGRYLAAHSGLGTAASIKKALQRSNFKKWGH